MEIENLKINSFVRDNATKRVLKVSGIDASGEIKTSSDINGDISLFSEIPSKLTVYTIEKKVGSIWELIEYNSFESQEKAVDYAKDLLIKDDSIKLIRSSIDDIEFIMIQNK